MNSENNNNINIYIIILNWNNFDDASKCIQSVCVANYPKFSIVLVDNASENNSLPRLKAAFGHISFVENKQNLGFTGGNNVGIKYALEHQADYVLLLNNDTVVKPDFLSELVRIAESDPQIGIVGPKIYFSNSKIIWFAGGFLNKKTGFAYHRGENEPDNGQYDNVLEIDFASGCAMLIKKEVFEKIGMLDEDYYHSHEDANFCVKAKEAGFKVVYNPASIIYHKLARSSGGRRSPFYLYYRTRNHLIFKEKLKINVPLFWPVFLLLLTKRIFGSLLMGQPRGAWATICGVIDFYAGKWGRGNGEKF